MQKHKLLASALLLFLPAISHAHLTVSPPQILLSSKGMAMTEVRSNLEESTYWQVRVVEWIQEEGKEVLRPMPEIAITPRFFRLAFSESQVIRALIPPELRKRYFRVLIEQIAENADPQKVMLNFRFSLPIYLSADEPVTRHIEFAPDQSCMDMSNAGDRAQQLDLPVSPRVLLPGTTSRVCRADP